MKLPLYHRPSALIFLDDETPYLEMLAFVLPRDWYVSFHTRASDFLHKVADHAQKWELDLQCHNAMIDQWYRGETLPKLILNYWRAKPDRYRLASTVVVDYAMPAVTGLDVLKATPAWPIWRVLLTGKADEHTAIAAFNEGLIHRFVTKQTPDLAQHLIQALRHHHHSPLDFHESVWRNVLRHSQQIALKDRTVQQALSAWLRDNYCVEYVVIPEPFGLLALDQDGYAHWLQMEMYKDLPAAVDLAKAVGHDLATLDAIAQGNILCDVEWKQALGLSFTPQVAAARTLGTGGHLIAAHFEQRELGVIGMGHKQFLAMLPPREVDAD